MPAEEQLEDVTAPTTPPEANGAPPPEWQRDRQNREYIGAQGRRGLIYRQGNETVEEALARDAMPADQRPKRRSRRSRKPPAAAKADLRELEAPLADALASPATLCALYGDEWAANHFAGQAPILARNLINAAEHNPWLRRQLEEATVSGTLPMKVMSMIGVGGAMVVYIVPPVIWWLNLNVPDKAREMFGVPPRREDEPEPEPPPESAQAPESEPLAQVA